MSMFTPEDLADMIAGGNVLHNSIYMARHNPRDSPIPNGSDIMKLKEFIRHKYVDKRWYDNPNSVHGSYTGSHAHDTKATNKTSGFAVNIKSSSNSHQTHGAAHEVFSRVSS